MARRDTAFPHFDIEDEGPPVEAALSAFNRDADEYWHRRPSDHGVTGLFKGGPEPEHCAIAGLIPYTHCAVSASTPEGERKRVVTTRSNATLKRARDWRDDARYPCNPHDENAELYIDVLLVAGEPLSTPRPRMVTTGGRFGRPAKPANSGRKRKVA